MVVKKLKKSLVRRKRTKKIAKGGWWWTKTKPTKQKLVISAPEPVHEGVIFKSIPRTKEQLTATNISLPFHPKIGRGTNTTNMTNMEVEPRTLDKSPALSHLLKALSNTHKNKTSPKLSSQINMFMEIPIEELKKYFTEDSLKSVVEDTLHNWLKETYQKGEYLNNENFETKFKNTDGYKIYKDFQKKFADMNLSLPLPKNLNTTLKPINNENIFGFKGREYLLKPRNKPHVNNTNEGYYEGHSEGNSEV
jgi:hypothetical protein